MGVQLGVLEIKLKIMEGKLQSQEDRFMDTEFDKVKKISVDENPFSGSGDRKEGVENIKAIEFGKKNECKAYCSLGQEMKFSVLLGGNFSDVGGKDDHFQYRYEVSDGGDFMKKKIYAKGESGSWKKGDRDGQMLVIEQITKVFSDLGMSHEEINYLLS